MSSPAAPTTTSTLASLHLSVFASALSPLLTFAELVATASTSRACRQLVLSPPVWRHRLVSSCLLPVLPSSTTHPPWTAVVQQLEVDNRGVECPEWPSPIPSLHLFPILRSVRMDHLGHSPAVRQPYPFPPVTSLASLRHLTQVSLGSSEPLDIGYLKLLASLPALSSFTARKMSFGPGNEETLREWLAVSATRRGTKRKAEEGIEVEEEKAPGIEANTHPAREDPSDLTLLQRHSPLLLFLHHLAAKPSLVHLRLQNCDLTPFVFDRMPVWPHLLCLSLEHSEELVVYSFANAAAQFPALTSFTSPNCSELAIQHLVALPRLEELCFGGRFMFGVDPRGVRETVRGFRVLSRATSLRSVQYYPPNLWYEEIIEQDAPDIYAALASVFTLTHLTRLTMLAFWLVEYEGVQPLSQLFPNLRCLELLVQVGDHLWARPHTDATFLPFVKPAHVVVSGRAERQAVRASKRPLTGEMDYSREGKVPPIPADNAANFPALECLALPYTRYNRGKSMGRVSVWMKQQLRRSYEYEEVEDWEAEMTTLGEAELLKTIA